MAVKLTYEDIEPFFSKDDAVEVDELALHLCGAEIVIWAKDDKGKYYRRKLSEEAVKWYKKVLKPAKARGISSLQVARNYLFGLKQQTLF
jgi:hypothetical protein